MISATCLTFDIDWAPDWCIERCVRLCQEASVPATFFMTHQTQWIDVISKDPLFELGIHPNFLIGSSHGTSTHDVLNFCLDLVPNAKSMRTHALLQSSLIFSIISDDFPQIETDVSLLLPLHPHLRPTDLYMGRTNRRLTRLPFFWEDDINSAVPNGTWRLPSVEDGLRIFNFHPVFLALNLAEFDVYLGLKESLGHRKLYEISEKEFAPYVNHGQGARTTFLKLIEDPKRAEFSLVSDITKKHREEVFCVSQ